MSLFSFNTFYLKNFFIRKFRKNSFIWSFFTIAQSLSFYFGYLFHYKFRLSRSANSIREIHLEFVSYCNLRCQLCSLDHQKPKIRMSETVLRRFFDDFLTDRRFSNVTTIHLYNAGEVLLHPQLDKMLAIIGEYKRRALKRKIRFPQIGLLTNATILDEENSRILINSGVLDHIRFSMDGGSREKFEEMRTRAKWDVFVKNIQTFCELNSKSETPIRTGIISLLEFNRDLSTEWMSAEFVKLLDLVDGYELRYAHNWAGELKLDELKNNGRKKSLKFGCSLLMQQLVLLPDGDITVCCADLNSKGVVGNVLKDKLNTIYNSPKRLEMLEKFMKRQKHHIELCKNCESF